MRAQPGPYIRCTAL